MAKGINEEWFELLTKETFPKFEGQKYEFSYIESWTDCPGEHPNMWIYYKLKKGIGCVDYKCGFDEADIPPRDLMVRGTYDGFVKLIRGEWDPVRAILSGKVKPINCSAAALIKNVACFIMLNESKRDIGWEY